MSRRRWAGTTGSARPGPLGLDAVRRPRPRPRPAARPLDGARTRIERFCTRDRRRHGRPRLRVQAADRPLRRAARRAPARGALPLHPRPLPGRRARSSTPSAATSARRPSSTPARRSTATAPTPSRSTRTSAPTPRDPFLERGGVLACAGPATPAAASCRTSTSTGRPLYQHVAAMVAERWSAHRRVRARRRRDVPRELGDVRAIVGDLPILVPGVGAAGRRHRSVRRAPGRPAAARPDRQLVAGDPLRVVRRRLRRGSPRRGRTATRDADPSPPPPSRRSVRRSSVATG